MKLTNLVGSFCALKFLIRQCFLKMRARVKMGHKKLKPFQFDIENEKTGGTNMAVSFDVLGGLFFHLI